MSDALRDYQRKFIGDYHDHRAAGDRRLLGVAPTGAGKTVIAVDLVRQSVATGPRILFLVHRRELIQQRATSDEWTP